MRGDSRIRCLAATLALAVVGLGALGVGTAGAVVLGNPDVEYDTADFGQGCGAPGPKCLFAHTRLRGATIKAPFAGRIRTWRFAAPGGGIEGQLVVLHKRSDGQFKAVNASELQTTPTFGDFAFETNMRIRKGEYIAFYGAQVSGRDNEDARIAYFSPPLLLGQSADPTAKFHEELLFNATLKR